MMNKIITIALIALTIHTIDATQKNKLRCLQAKSSQTVKKESELNQRDIQTKAHTLSKNMIIIAENSLKNMSLSDADTKALMMNLDALTSPKPRMAGVRFTDKNAAELYSKTKEAFYAIKNSPALSPEENFEIGVALIRTIQKMVTAKSSKD